MDNKNTPDWDYWHMFNHFTIEESACLCANLEPFEWDLASDKYSMLSKYHRMITRSLEDRELYSGDLFKDLKEPRITKENLMQWISRREEFFSKTADGLAVLQGFLGQTPPF